MAQNRLSGTASWDKIARGTPDDLSDEQKQVLQEFLAAVPKDDLDCMRFPCEPPEYFGCRVLRARKFDVAAALKLVADTAKWRRDNSIGDLPSKTPFQLLGCLEDELLAHYPKAYFPVPDREGRPVYVEHTGHVDVECMMLLTDIDRLLSYHTYTYEVNVRKRLIDYSAVAGRPITTLASILDLEGGSAGIFNAVSRQYIARATAIDSAHYPETLGHMVIINAPGFFTMIWRIIAKMLDERTVRKIDILGGPSAWRPVLESVIGKDRLPVQYGGTYQVDRIFHVSRTRCTHLSSGKLCFDVIALPAATTARFKWYCRPGDVRFSLEFFAGQPPPALTTGGGGVGVSRPEPVRYCRAPSDALTSAEAEVLGKLRSSSSNAITSSYALVSELKDYPSCDKEPVVLTHTAPVDGFYVLTFDNWAGWRGRDLFHRWDVVIDGQPVEDPLLHISSGFIASLPPAPAAVEAQPAKPSKQ